MKTGGEYDKDDAVQGLGSEDYERCWDFRRGEMRIQRHTETYSNHNGELDFSADADRMC